MAQLSGMGGGGARLLSGLGGTLVSGTAPAKGGGSSHATPNVPLPLGQQLVYNAKSDLFVIADDNGKVLRWATNDEINEGFDLGNLVVDEEGGAPTPPLTPAPQVLPQAVQPSTVDALKAIIPLRATAFNVQVAQALGQVPPPVGGVAGGTAAVDNSSNWKSKLPPGQAIVYDTGVKPGQYVIVDTRTGGILFKVADADLPNFFSAQPTVTPYESDTKLLPPNDPFFQAPPPIQQVPVPLGPPPPTVPLSTISAPTSLFPSAGGNVTPLPAGGGVVGPKGQDDVWH